MKMSFICMCQQARLIASSRSSTNPGFVAGLLRKLDTINNYRVSFQRTFYYSSRRNILDLAPPSVRCLDAIKCQESRLNARTFVSEVDEKSLLLKHIHSRIKGGGPITVADYMREVLTNPHSMTYDFVFSVNSQSILDPTESVNVFEKGYYMHKDVFGTEGDFITSPEISQMFGEMIGVWIVNEWMNHYQDQFLQIVELGPGRGTLSDDMLRVFSQFPAIRNKINLHLVEVSPVLGSMQAATLSGKDASGFDHYASKDNDKGPYAKCTSKYGQDVYWYQSLTDVPKGLSCFIAHEFLDALPIHKFQKTEQGWREILVDIDEKDASSEKLRFVLSPTDTTASVAYLKPSLSATEERDHIEISPGSALIVQNITKRIKESGGFSLIADYGHNGDKTDTFRAFKNHQLHDSLVEPGTADLTADVDFSYLKKFTDDQVDVFGPITQEKYLMNMGIGLRLQALLQRAKQEDWTSLISGYKMLTSPDQMGERFKFMSITSKSKDNYIPAGFVDLNIDGNESGSK